MSMQAPTRCPLALWVLVLLLGLLPASGVGAGAANKLERLLDFAIPAQDLGTALDRYSQTSGLAILLDRELARGRRSAPVSGRFQARQALEQLLAGSGLVALYTGADAFTVKPAQLPVGSDKRRRNGAPGSANGSFASALQEALRQRLCQSALTRPGQYRAALQLWVGPLGDVQHSRLLASTGNEQRDTAIVQGLRELSIGQLPPSSLAQPVTVLVLPDTAASHMECKPSEGVVKP